MIEEKNRENEEKKDYEVHPEDVESMPREEATRQAKQGQWGQSEENDEGFGHSPAAGKPDEDKEDEK